MCLCGRWVIHLVLFLVFLVPVVYLVVRIPALNDALAWLCRENRREGALESHREEIVRRVSDRQHVASEVAVQRMKLSEATAVFRALDAASGFRACQPVRAVSPCSEEEKYRREVLAWVRDFLPQRTAEGEAILRRLEAELHD